MKHGRRLIAKLLIACFLLTAGLAGTTFSSEAKTGMWKKDAKGYRYEYSRNVYARNKWEKIGKNYYYFGADGYMESSGYRNGYWIGSDGIRSKKNVGGHWVSKKGKKWFIDKAGWYPKNRWLKINGKFYYFDKKGFLVRSTWIGNRCVNAKGEWAKTASKAWAKAYKDYITKSFVDEDHFALIYIDNDSIPELVASAGRYYSVYTYKGGQVKILTSFMGISSIRYADHGCYYEINTDARDYNDAEGGYVNGKYSHICKLVKGKYTYIGKGGYTTAESDGRVIEKVYRWSGKSIAKSAFTKRVNSLFAKLTVKTMKSTLQYTRKKALSTLRKIIK